MIKILQLFHTVTGGNYELKVIELFPFNKELFPLKIWTIHIFCTNMESKVGDRSRGRPEGSFFNSYYT